MSIVHWMIVIGVVVLLFGRHKISDLMGDVAHGIKSFKRGIQEDGPVSMKTDEKQAERSTAPSTLAVPVPTGFGEKGLSATKGNV